MKNIELIKKYGIHLEVKTGKTVVVMSNGHSSRCNAASQRVAL